MVETAENVEMSVAEQSPYELSQYLSSIQAKVFPDLTSLELEAMQIPGEQAYRMKGRVLVLIAVFQNRQSQTQRHGLREGHWMTLFHL